MRRWLQTFIDGLFERHFSGPSSPRDFDDLYDLAPEELERRVKAGDGKAAYVLGDMHDKGQLGEAADFQEALRWYRRAEELEDGDALNNLGSMHHHGELLEKDLQQAIRYYQRAGLAGCAVGWGNLGRLYLKGDGLPQAPRKARRLLWKAVRGGDPNAMLGLGYAYHVGAFSPKPLRALYCYRKAASYGEAAALFNLGLMYWHGRHVLRNDKKALSLFQEAADNGHVAAIYYCGIAYRDGRGIEPSQDLAFEAFLKAADLGNTEAAHDRDELVSAEPSLNAKFGDHRRHLGDYAGALKLYRHALPYLEAQSDPETRLRFLRANAGLASCLHQIENFSDARRINTMILPEIEKISGETSDDAHVVRKNLADNLLRMGDISAALSLANHMAALNETSRDFRRLYDTLNLVAVLKFEQGMFQDADDLLRRRIRIAADLEDATLEDAARRQHAAMLKKTLFEGGAETLS